MDTLKVELLTETVAEVLEMVAFLCSLPYDEEFKDEKAENDGEIVCVGLEFQEPVSGKLFISLPEPLTPIIAANMLGIDEDEDDVKQKSTDATKEILNIICGNLLLKIYGDKSVFHLGTPHVVENLENELSVFNKSDVFKTELEVENYKVTTIFALK